MGLTTGEGSWMMQHGAWIFLAQWKPTLNLLVFINFASPECFRLPVSLALAIQILNINNINYSQPLQQICVRPDVQRKTNGLSPVSSKVINTIIHDPNYWSCLEATYQHLQTTCWCHWKSQVMRCWPCWLYAGAHLVCMADAPNQSRTRWRCRILGACQSGLQLWISCDEHKLT